MRVLIAGAGRGGLSLAVDLQSNGNVVTMVERDETIARRASDEHGIVVLVGDATDAGVLRQAAPERSDAVLAMLHRDADNLAVAMLARALGANRVMVRMRDPEYRAVYESAGVQQILSETEMLVGALAAAVQFSAIRHSMVLGSGESIAFEIAVPKGAWVNGRTIGDVATSKRFPSSCVIAGMTLGGSVQAPRGGSTIDAGMQLLVVSSRADLEATVSFFLRAREDGEG